MAKSSTLWLGGVGVVILLLVAASISLALLNPEGGVTEYPADAPEGVVQRYLKALEDQDYPRAHSYLASGVQSKCSVEDVRMSARWLAESRSSRRIELVGKETLSSGTVQVRVRVVEVNVNPPFGVDESSHDEWYPLVREGGPWRLESPGWPVFGCTDLREPATP